MADADPGASPCASGGIVAAPERQVANDTCESPPFLPESLIVRAEEMLTQSGNDRSSATDLLAADALITYAMEAAAEYDLDVESIAENVAIRLATVASRGGQP